MTLVQAKPILDKLAADYGIKHVNLDELDFVARTCNTYAHDIPLCVFMLANGIQHLRSRGAAS